MHRSLPCVVPDRTGPDEDQVGHIEVPHGPRNGSDVPLTLRLDENDADVRHRSRYIPPAIMTVRMRVALKIAYEGRAFHGHQRQPDVRTVEGECLAALKAAKIIRDPAEAFFRSASRTDRGVSAVGNVIAFNTTFRPEAALGAFNDRARDVWAWAVATLPVEFHPRHALERWYRYHLFENLPLGPLRDAAALFKGEHDVRSFTSDPPRGLLPINDVEVARDEDMTVLDVRAPAFRRGMVRRIAAAIVGHARGDVPLSAIRAALHGERRDFGMAPAENLVLVDVRYDVPFRPVLIPKVVEEWRRIERDARFRLRLIGAFRAAERLADRPKQQSRPSERPEADAKRF